MIALLNKKICLDPVTPAAVWISAQQKAFGGTGLAVFYEQTADGETTAYISSVSGAVTLLAFDGADFEELGAFLPGVGNHLWCEGDTVSKLGFSADSWGDILQICPGFEKSDGSGDTRGFAPLSSVYGLLCSEFQMPPFETWYADLFRNISAGTQRVFAVFECEKAVACAVLSAVTEAAAILSAVVTDRNSRSRGLASECVRNALKFAGQRTVFVMTREPSLNGFYGKFGFAPFGRWNETEI